jgi:hypothetical protein
MSEQTNHQEILKAIDSIKEEMATMNKKIDPMYEVFTSVNGFNKIAVWIMKVLAGIAVALGGLYALIEFFKKLSKN